MTLILFREDLPVAKLKKKNITLEDFNLTRDQLFSIDTVVYKEGHTTKVWKVDIWKRGC